MTAAQSVTATFNLSYTVTPTAGTGGNVSPATVQTVNSGDTAQFTVTPNSGYGANVAGTCPPGYWSDNTYTTGTITANCTVNFSFALTGINDTGITTCANATQNGLPCPVAGFPRQDAEYGTNSFSFTKLDANGNALPATATNHSCVQDNITGLMWEVKTADGGLRDKGWTYTWYSSIIPNGAPNNVPSGGTCQTAGRCDTEKFVADVNTAGLCGHNDWRLPNPQELAGIVDYGIASPGPVMIPTTSLIQ